MLFSSYLHAAEQEGVIIIGIIIIISSVVIIITQCRWCSCGSIEKHEKKNKRQKWETMTRIRQSASALKTWTEVTAHLKSKQLLLFVFELQDYLLPSSNGILTAAQRQIAVTAYLKSEQLLLFVFELQDYLLPSSNGILAAEQRQTATIAHLKSKQLLLFVFPRPYYYQFFFYFSFTWNWNCWRNFQLQLTKNKLLLCLPELSRCGCGFIWWFILHTDTADKWSRSWLCLKHLSKEGVTARPVQERAHAHVH